MINETRNTTETAVEKQRTDIRTLSGHESWQGGYYHLRVDLPTDEVDA